MADVVGGANKRQHMSNAVYYKVQYDRTRKNKKRKLAKAIAHAKATINDGIFDPVAVGADRMDARKANLDTLKKVQDAWMDPWYRSSKEKSQRQGGFYKYA